MTTERTSQGDCPKHGRWYGICHSCYADAERQREWEERRRMIIRIERLEAVARAVKQTDLYSYHPDHCRYEYRGCTCGRDELMKALAALEGE